jgi:tetratricopeptide (TPR) repeat protein
MVIVVSIFDRFKPKSGDPQGLAEVKVQFTADENEAINRTLERYATVANADAPEGMRMFVAPKVTNGMAAQGLAEYVEDLMRKSRNCDSNAKIATLMDKAIKAQMKAYAVHNLPIYLFQLAELFEFAGDATKAREFYRHFLRAQDAFKPDQIDTLFVNQMGFDLPKVVMVSKEKVAQTEPNLIETVDVLGDGLVSGATEIAGSILEELGKFDNSIELRQENTTTQFVIEVIVFYMHLVDRLAFAHLGAAKRNIFFDRLIIAVVKIVLRALSKEGSADDLGGALRDTYNRRQIE